MSDWVPNLELPPAPDSPVTKAGEILGADSIAMTTAKLAVAESLLRLVVKNHKFGEFAREVLVTIMRVVKCEAASILEINHSDKTIFFRAAAGRCSDRMENFVIPMGKGIVGYVAESCQPVSVLNAAENEIHLKSIAQAVGFEAKNIAAVPIIVRGNIYGVLELINRVGEESFTNTDMELLSYSCEMAAKAFEIRFMLAWLKRESEKVASSPPKERKAA